MVVKEGLGPLYMIDTDEWEKHVLNQQLNGKELFENLSHIFAFTHSFGGGNALHLVKTAANKEENSISP